MSRRPVVGTKPGSDTVGALAPLRAALLEHARAEAGRIRAQAESEAAALVEAARDELDDQVEKARAQGAADARALVRLERGRVRQENREVVLRAQRQAYDELVARAADAVRALLSEPAVRARLEQRLRDRLGPATELVDTPDGGVRARSPQRGSVDASVDALVHAALERLDLEELWAAAG
jgi:vacuolar-type H+-ATPase subunit E/Vma4